MDLTQYRDEKILDQDPRKPDPRYVRGYHKAGKDYLRKGTGTGAVVERTHLPVLTLSGTDNEDGTCTITAAVTDWFGNAVTDAYLLECWISETALGAAADPGDIEASTGRIVTEHVADCVFQLATNSAGVAVVTVTGPDQTGVFHASLGGKIVQIELEISGNS